MKTFTFLSSQIRQSQPKSNALTRTSSFVSLPRSSFSSNQLTIPTISSMYYLVRSVLASCSCSKTYSVSQSIRESALFKYSYRRIVSRFGLLSGSLFRSLLLCASNGYSTSRPRGTLIVDEKCRFESTGNKLGDGTRKSTVKYDGSGPITPKRISEIIEVIRNDPNEHDLHCKLNSMSISLSTASISEILQILNRERVSAVCFFAWIKRWRPELSRSSEICSLVIENCGRLGDYEAMLSLLKEFGGKQVCLTELAFGFVPLICKSKCSMMDFIRRLIHLLNEVQGSSHSSGIHALIKMFGKLESFEMAKFVIEITEKKTSYYNKLILAMCVQHKFKEAHDMLNEMRQLGCEPNTKTYNYILGSLCKNDMTAEACKLLEEMQEKGCPYDAITLEIFVCYLCKIGKFNCAIEFIDRMVLRGVEPRYTTDAILIKGYFNYGKFQDAYRYVVESHAKNKCTSNMNYSLLASLHQCKGNIVIAQNVLIEMIEKGLKPNYMVYRRVLKGLHRLGEKHLTSDLRNKFLQFKSESY